MTARGHSPTAYTTSPTRSSTWRPSASQGATSGCRRSRSKYSVGSELQAHPPGDSPTGDGPVHPPLAVAVEGPTAGVALLRRIERLVDPAGAPLPAPGVGARRRRRGHGLRCFQGVHRLSAAHRGVAARLRLTSLNIRPASSRTLASPVHGGQGAGGDRHPALRLVLDDQVGGVRGDDAVGPGQLDDLLPSSALSPWSRIWSSRKPTRRVAQSRGMKAWSRGRGGEAGVEDGPPRPAAPRSPPRSARRRRTPGSGRKPPPGRHGRGRAALRGAAGSGGPPPETASLRVGQHRVADLGEEARHLELEVLLGQHVAGAGPGSPR